MNLVFIKHTTRTNTIYTCVLY